MPTYGVDVIAWRKNGNEMEMIGTIDLSDLEVGMWVRTYNGEYHEVVGDVYEDEIDYMIPLDNCGDYSPLLVD